MKSPAPFIYNILWAIIEPPVFIIGGCLLTLGPLYRAKYGPRTLFQRFSSKILSKSTSSAATSNPNNYSESVETLRKKYPWAPHFNTTEQISNRTANLEDIELSRFESELV